MVDRLPEAIKNSLAAAQRHDPDAVALNFTADTTIREAGTTYSGHEGVRAWVRNHAEEYEDTVTHAYSVDRGHYILVDHVEGDFPGRVADLLYEINIDEAGLIVSLRVTL
jgi:hypothetical protein